MQINYEITKQDLIEFNMYHMDKTNTMKQMIFKQQYLYPLVTFVYPLSMLYWNVPLSDTLPLFVLVYLFKVISYPSMRRSGILKNTTKIMDEIKDASGNRCIQLNEDAILYTTKYVETRTNYIAVDKVVETKDYIYIYLITSQGYIIPIRSFESIDQKNEFMNRMNRFVEKSKLENKIEDETIPQ